MLFDVEKALMQKELITKATKILATHDRRQAILIKKVFKENLTVSEAAVEVGLTEHQAHTEYSRALVILRQIINGLLSYEKPQNNPEIKEYKPINMDKFMMWVSKRKNIKTRDKLIIYDHFIYGHSYRDIADQHKLSPMRIKQITMVAKHRYIRDRRR